MLTGIDTAVPLSAAQFESIRKAGYSRELSMTEIETERRLTETEPRKEECNVSWN